MVVQEEFKAQFIIKHINTFHKLTRKLMRLHGLQKMGNIQKKSQN